VGGIQVVTIPEFHIENLLSLIQAVSGNAAPAPKAKKLP
jgi:hypothetical protein